MALTAAVYSSPFLFCRVDPITTYMEFAGILTSSRPATFTELIMLSCDAKSRTGVTVCHDFFSAELWCSTFSSLIKLWMCFKLLHPKIPSVVSKVGLVFNTKNPTFVNVHPNIFTSTYRNPRYGICRLFAATKFRKFRVSLSSKSERWSWYNDSDIVETSDQVSKKQLNIWP